MVLRRGAALVVVVMAACGGGDGSGRSDAAAVFDGAVADGTPQGDDAAPAEADASFADGAPTITDCSDGVDNDDDALVDVGDPGCSAAEDDDESDAQCADGVDNDFDGLVDGDDGQCAVTPGAEADLAALPDLSFLEDRALVITDESQQPLDVPQVLIQSRVVAVSDPEFAAGCLTGTGTRRLLAWNSVVANLGADLVIGNPASHPGPWALDATLGGMRMSAFVRATLRDAFGEPVLQRDLSAGCIVDILSLGGTSQFDSCGDGEGISAQYATVHAIGLECQYLDVTGVPAGLYSLELEVDPRRLLPDAQPGGSVQFGVEIP